MEADQQKIKERIQKDIRYSALTTMTLRLVKKYKIYQNCRHLEIQNSIKKRKNFSIIVMRLCSLTKKIMREQGLMKQKAVEQIYIYLIDNIKKVLEEKYFQPKQQNQQMLLDFALETSLRDIQVLKDALLADPGEIHCMVKIVSKLFMSDKETNQNYTQRRATQNLSKLFCCLLKESYEGKASGGEEVYDKDIVGNGSRVYQANKTTNSEYVERFFQTGQGNENENEVQFQVGENQQQSMFQVLQL